MVFQNDFLELLAIIFMVGLGFYLLYCFAAIAMAPLVLVAAPLALVASIAVGVLKIILPVITYAVVFIACLISDLYSKISKRRRQKM